MRILTVLLIFCVQKDKEGGARMAEYYRTAAKQLENALSEYYDGIVVFPPQCRPAYLMEALLSSFPNGFLYVSLSAARLLLVKNELSDRGISAEILQKSSTPDEIRTSLSRPHTVLLTEPEVLLSPVIGRYLWGCPRKIMLIDEAQRASVFDSDFSVRYEYVHISECRYSFHFPTLALSETPLTEADWVSAAETLHLNIGVRLNAPAEISGARLRILHLREKERFDSILSLAGSSKTGNVLFCTSTPEETEDICGFLEASGYPALSAHECMSVDAISAAAERFLSGKGFPAVCTDEVLPLFCHRPPHTLVHTSLPRSIGVYARSVQYAVRFGNPVLCVLLFHPDDAAERIREQRESRTNGAYAITDEAALDALLYFSSDALDTMAAFTDSARCLLLALSEYVGSPRCRSCGCCSVCEPDCDMTDVTDDALSVLHCIRKGNIRREALIPYLCGTLPEGRGKYYGCLANRPKAYVNTLIRRLIQEEKAEIIIRDETEYLKDGVCAPMLLSGHNRFFLPRDTLGPLTPAETELLAMPYDRALLSSLQKLRRRLSIENCCPTYRIFGNYTLRALAVLKPFNMHTLRLVPGMPEETATEYGDMILSCIASYKAKMY